MKIEYEEKYRILDFVPEDTREEGYLIWLEKLCKQPNFGFIHLSSWERKGNDNKKHLRNLKVVIEEYCFN